MLHRLGVLVNRIPAISPPERPLGILKENYAKTVGRHPTTSPFAKKIGDSIASLGTKGSQDFAIIPHTDPPRKSNPLLASELRIIPNLS
jgi:hypothetical protein